MRGQISLEAIMVTSIAILVFASLLQVASERTALVRDVGEGGEVKMVGNLLAEAINNVYANGEGFRIYLGPDILNYTYLKGDEGNGLGITEIKINSTGREIILRKNMSETGMQPWNTTVSIIPNKVVVINTTITPTTYNETTILNNGTNVVIYSAHIGSV
jgi:hypothetical protein